MLCGAYGRKGEGPYLYIFININMHVERSRMNDIFRKK